MKCTQRNKSRRFTEKLSGKTTCGDLISIRMNSIQPPYCEPLLVQPRLSKKWLQWQCDRGHSRLGGLSGQKRTGYAVGPMLPFFAFFFPVQRSNWVSKRPRE